MFSRCVTSLLLGATLILTNGCSSGYRPAQSPRVSVIMDGGTISFVKNGQLYPGGLLAGGVAEAVQGNALAEEYASSYQRGMTIGIGGYLLGLGSVVAATTVLETGNRRDTSRQTVAGGLFLGGVAALVTGVAFMLNAQPKLWDAVNAYNDSVAATGSPEVAGQPSLPNRSSSSR